MRKNYEWGLGLWLWLWLGFGLGLGLGRAQACGVMKGIKGIETPDYSTKPSLTYICDVGVEPAVDNNYCMSDDIVAYQSANYFEIVAGGCPDHRYFSQGAFTTYTDSGAYEYYGDDGCDGGGCCDGGGGCCDGGGCCSGGCCCSGGGGGGCNPGNTTNNTTTRKLKRASLSDGSDCCGDGCYFQQVLNPYTPRYKEYTFKIPKAPLVKERYSPLTMSDRIKISNRKNGDPIGVTVTGIPIFSDHLRYTTNGTIINRGIKSNVDNCAGHADTDNRYHFHGLPLCLMQNMFQFVPKSGTKYMKETNPVKQASYWPSKGTPSPILGFALDGYPIMGPYNAQGNLQLSIGHPNATLNACNFDSTAGHYHFSPSAPFAPSCFVGSMLGSYGELSVEEGVCPSNGRANSYCKGNTCIVRNQQSQKIGLTPFNDIYFLVTFLFLIVDVVGMFIYKWYRISSDKPIFPWDVTMRALIPALLAWMFVNPIYVAFFSLDHGYTISTEVLEFIGDVAGSFLSVLGLVYGLVISTVLSQAHDRFIKVFETISEEVAQIHNAMLVVHSLYIRNKIKSEMHKRRVSQIMMLLVNYTDQMLLPWLTLEDVCELEVSIIERTTYLTTTIEIMRELNDDLTTSKVDGRADNEIAAVYVELVNSIIRLYHLRRAYEANTLPLSTWLLNDLLSSLTFIGVLMVFTGSQSMSFFICFASVLAIAGCTTMIVDYDSIYVGSCKLDDGIVRLLRNTLIRVQKDDIFRKKTTELRAYLDNIDTVQWTKTLQPDNLEKFVKNYDNVKMPIKRTLPSQLRKQLSKQLSLGTQKSEKSNGSSGTSIRRKTRKASLVGFRRDSFIKSDKSSLGSKDDLEQFRTDQSFIFTKTYDSSDERNAISWQHCYNDTYNDDRDSEEGSSGSREFDVEMRVESKYIV